MKFENTDVWGFAHAIRGMRNPMNSWDKSDSYWGLKEDESPINPCDEPFLADFCICRYYRAAVLVEGI